MGNCDNCPSKATCTSSKESCTIENNPSNKVKHLIGIMSGKGGVGKSTVCALIASELRARGYSVGVLDADITGPTIPRLFGIEDKKALSDGRHIYPVKTSTGIGVMSMNLLLDREEEAVIWRGPMVAGVVKQFWTDVIWGELDYLIVDMPPGTGDVPLTAMQSLPITGIVLVSTPQNFVSMIVAKAVDMIKKMNVKVLGVIENMSYMTCPECSHKIEIFGSNAAYKSAEKVGTELLGELPMDKDLMALSDEGRVELFGKLKDEFKSIVDNILNKL